jgi:hypothetical protein
VNRQRTAHSSFDLELTHLEESRLRFARAEAKRVTGLLAKFVRHHFDNPHTLIRFHEALLFLRAFPHGPSVVAQTERLLNSFHERVEKLRADGADMTVFDTFESCGIVGTAMQDALSFDVAQWLARHLPKQVEIAWDDYEEDRALASTWPRFLPLLDEDGFAEANIPWRRWIETAAGSKSRELHWLLQRFDQLPLSKRELAEIYESLRLPVRWHLGNLRLSRSRNWRRPRNIFYHHEFIPRSAIHLDRELAQPAHALKKLSRREGQAVLELAREVMLVRYRELYGTTFGDPRSVVRADIGRGTIIYLWNLPPERRLPLRAYIAGLTIKNGVPIGYMEAMSLCEWLEFGFNMFYTFRGGETAWIFAQALRCLRKLTGATCISIYPYQLGKGSDEALESGAFWFYRKLGFRPGRPELLRLTEREEKKIAASPSYKTPLHTLQRLAEGHVFYELAGTEPQAWDRFSTRNLGFRVNRRMAKQFGGHSERVQQASVKTVGRSLGVDISRWNDLDKEAFKNWALVLALIPNLARWNPQEKADLLRIIRAQTGSNEMRYLRLTQKHARLRREMLRLGSSAG